MAPAEVEQVRQAFELAQTACGDTHGERQLTLIAHALAVATIIAEMHIDAVGVASGMIFEAVDADLLSLERVETTLGVAVARVVGSMLRMNILERKKQSAGANDRSRSGATGDGDNTREQKKQRIREALRRQQAETVRKMFFAMSEDPRVVLLKLAYRLHAMRLISEKAYPVDQQEMLTMAQETREIYAPLAGRLGVSRVESELDDLAFQVLEPDKYAWVRNMVEAESKQWSTYVDRICHILEEEMQKLGLHAEVSGRVKHLYSFYKKLQRTAGDVERLEDLKAAADFGQIHDLVAFRILVDSTPDCYLALGHVRHDEGGDPGERPAAKDRGEPQDQRRDRLAIPLHGGCRGRAGVLVLLRLLILLRRLVRLCLRRGRFRPACLSHQNDLLQSTRVRGRTHQHVIKMGAVQQLRHNVARRSRSKLPNHALA